ncbi:MAG: type I-C CRISPR-associated endonuclease Cas1 [Clostridiaceae bacterium]|nr:type I-C CRISPR-associated endonuclease Cas1 [Clostridiaceae bacterium]
MKKLLNTLYVLTPESYLYCRNDNICVRIGEAEKVAIPAITVDSILCFGQMTVSTPLLQFCGERGISITFLTENGKFQGRFYGPVSGNVLLRKRQYESLHDNTFCVQFVRTLLFAKVRNAKLVLMRAARNCDDCEFSEKLDQAVTRLTEAAQQLSECESVDSMRGIEGAAATAYFSQFDTMLRQNPGGFRFETRSRRPPRNAVNAALSFTYMLLANQTQSAMEAVGLDPAAGYLHTLRPGRASFALDLMEELRAPLCDRFVLSLFNKGQLSVRDFDQEEESVYLNERGRKTLLASWQKRKADEILHPFLNEKVQIGMIPYVQAMLFARVLRGDLDEYPPFVWR